MTSPSRNMETKAGQTVTADGGEWTVVSVGASEDGATYVHLASTTKGVQQRNGFRRAQVCGWLRGDRLTVRP